MSSMNETPGGERIHIGLFGRRNAGKSSLFNAITNQNLAVVSKVRGTTTDPVKKAMELLPLGPVVLIDTPGLDDEGVLGSRRTEKALEVLRRVDIVLLVLDGSVLEAYTNDLLQECAVDDEVFSIEKELLAEADRRKIPALICINKMDSAKEEVVEKAVRLLGRDLQHSVFLSVKEGRGIEELKARIGKLCSRDAGEKPLVRDLLHPQELVVLVVPIDSAAPKGRLILPQQQVIRDVLEAGAIPVVTRETELTAAFQSLAKKPGLVITDSQAFAEVSRNTPEEIPLTSFSILMARYKGDLNYQVAGARAVETLQNGDVVLIAEGCTHHRQCEDIGTVKMPRWISDYTKKKLQFVFTSGTEFPSDLSPYRLIVHCGGCTLNSREMEYRLRHAAQEGVPMTNYGVMIAYIHGILDRAAAPFGIAPGQEI